VTVDEYIAAADPDRRKALRALRDVIRAAAPQAREEIRHRMPYYAYHGDVVAFASHKNYFSLYVMGGKRLIDHRDAFGKLNCGKSCIRFKRLDELPLDVIREIVRDTAAANEAAASSH
jgi:uncharacterized protein YdhG (YjbR/CyaY superfamily)